MDVATAIIALLCGVIVLLIILSEGRNNRVRSHKDDDENKNGKDHDR